LVIRAQDTLSEDKLLKLIDSKPIQKKNEGGIRKFFASKHITNQKTSNSATRSNTFQREVIKINGLEFERSFTMSGEKDYICAGCNNKIPKGHKSITLLKLGDSYEDIKHRHCHDTKKCWEEAGRKWS
jgi:hypothetical protein